MNLIPAEEVTPLTPQAFHVLLALSEKDMYGYGILQQCQSDAEGSINLDPGSTYRLLRRLKSAGFIQSTVQLPAKGSRYDRQYLSLTPTGRLVLQWECQRYRRLSILGQHRLNRQNLTPQFAQNL